MAAKVAREFEESYILLAHVVENANGAESFGGEPDDLAARTAEFALQRLRSLDGRVEMLFEESV